jgi:hypothetical protein
VYVQIENLSFYSTIVMWVKYAKKSLFKGFFFDF